MVETTFLRMVARASKNNGCSRRSKATHSNVAHFASCSRRSMPGSLRAGCSQGRVAGCALVLFWRRLPYAGTSLHAELASVFVEPAQRRHGFARELCPQTLALARARDVRPIVVHPSQSAAGLYRELGFSEGNEMRLSAADAVTGSAMVYRRAPSP